MAASDYVPKLSKYRLHPKGRPQMESGRWDFAFYARVQVALSQCYSPQAQLSRSLCLRMTMLQMRR